MFFFFFIDYVCEEISALQSTDIWIVGWQRVKEGQYGREKGKGQYRLGSDCPGVT